MFEQTLETNAAQSSAISKLVVQTTAEFTGRGPTKAQTQLNEHFVTVVLRDILTKGEQSLVRDGSGEVVLMMRQAFQRTMEPVLVAGVERITGREVVAFLSANHIDPDVAIETFVFAPHPDHSPLAED